MEHMDNKNVDFINDTNIKTILKNSCNKNKDDIFSIIEKAKEAKGLTVEEVASLLQNSSNEIDEKLFEASRQVKNKIYGTRIVMFAPLYVSNFCINSCNYCGYKCENSINRKKLSDSEILKEIDVILSLGHKRIVLESGEDPQNADINYILNAMRIIYNHKYNNNYIRRINVNIAATTVENYKKLKDAGIGTYILFQETYNKNMYEKLHPRGPKSNYDYHTLAMDRAMLGGIDDVGIGVLFGLYDYKYEVISMLLHANHLEKTFGVGPHTLSVPRLKKAKDVSLDKFKYIVSDHDFKRIVAILRLTVPYAGIILSTREEPGFREEVIDLGVSQISAGSCTGVGEYNESKSDCGTSQFEVADNREPIQIIKELCNKGYIPSYCTACYRAGRTGDRFMEFAKTGNIHNLCYPNALMTFKEYIEDFGDEELKLLGNKLIEDNLKNIPNKVTLEKTKERLERIHNGERDLFF